MHSLKEIFSLSTLALLTAACANAQTVTFEHDVLPILQKRCQTCHRPGEAGSGSFLTYESTRPWAQAIKAKVLTRKMPPWFASPDYGHFQNDRRLTAAEIKTLVAWVDSGAPEGDPRTAPKSARAKWTNGWSLPPDVVYTMDKPYVVPAKGNLDYVYIVIPTNFRTNTWITAGEVRPSDRSVVHHVSVFFRPPGSSWLKDARPGVPYTIPKTTLASAAFRRQIRPGVDNAETLQVESGAEFLVGYSPGMPAQDFSVGHGAKMIPAESDLVLELHCTPNGKISVPEKIAVGFVYSKVDPVRRFLTISAWTPDIAIPPGDADYEGHASLHFNQEADLVFLQPHMHLRGKDMTVRLVYPDGRSETLLEVPNYDFNWQIIYYEARPLHIPKGSRLEITAHWDNSANNPYNPDPSEEVRLGPQNTDEMLVCHTGITVDPNESPESVVTVEYGR